MKRAEPSDPHSEAGDIDLLWEAIRHEDDLLATRVSVFLLAQSILIAVTVSLVSTVAGLTHSSSPSLRPEMFGLAISINVVGLALTLVFWYAFTLNFDNIGTLFDELDRILSDIDPNHVRMRITRERVRRRNNRWYFRIIFHRKSVNWVIVNMLPLGFLFLWCVVGIFSLVIFVSK